MNLAGFFLAVLFLFFIPSLTLVLSHNVLTLVLGHVVLNKIKSSYLAQTPNLSKVTFLVII